MGSTRRWRRAPRRGGKGVAKGILVLEEKITPLCLSKVRCFVADARTHQRCYIVEMMGADGGFHALHSCIGGGAHYAALVDPLSDEELARVATAVDRRKGDKSKMY